MYALYHYIKIYHNESSCTKLYQLFIQSQDVEKTFSQEGGSELGLRGPVAPAGLGAAEERRRGGPSWELDGKWMGISPKRQPKISGISEWVKWIMIIYP